MSAINTILIADDHALVRDGLRALLSEEAEMEVIAEADNGHDAVRLACALHPSLVLMDLSMPGINGLDATAEIKRQWPDIKILVITVHKADEYVHSALRLGASGYMGKESGHSELLTAIRALLGGKVYLSPDISERVLTSLFSGGMKNVSARDTLTIREHEVLRFVAEGNSNRDIAGYLHLSIKTVEKHRSSLMRKLGLRNASMLTAYAIEKGVVANFSHGDDFRG